MIQESIPFTIVMPSYLGHYKTAAKNRERKLHRAINSVLSQTHEDWELMFIADGCQKSKSIIAEYLSEPRISAYIIERDGLWAGSPRNTGIQNAKHEFIIYLDSDDEYRSMYLQQLSDAMLFKEADWYIVNDYIYDKSVGYKVRYANIDKLGECGTSNVIHKKSLNVFWPQRGSYAHDFKFINGLKAASDKHIKLDVVGYVVQHIPSVYDL